MPIKVLAPEVVARIAAGEVVERPASVVKELIENSLDAGAREISVEVAGGGVSLIRVADNGSGIPAAEAALAFERYATSKIIGLDDLDSIASLGFRGEALASIAAVAEVEITTSAAGEPVGTCIAVKGGRVTGQRRQARAPGTTVVVKNLFREIPARLKFLKSLATENAYIAGVVTRYALAFPEVRFILSVDGRVTLRTPGSGRLADSVAEIYGLELARGMLEIKAGDWEGNALRVQVTGLTGSPGLGRTGRDYLSLFVNRRWVNHRGLAWAVEEAYHGLLMTGKHPVAVINIAVSPEEVDVNVHPAKTEVKFRDEPGVYSAVQRAVRRTLVEMAPVPEVREATAQYAAPPAPQHHLWGTPPGHPADTAPPASQAALARTLPVLRVVGQLLASYIVAEGPDGLYLIDQHAAHERVLFEEVQAKRQQGLASQSLLAPELFEVSPRQAEAMKTCLDGLAGFGFSLAPFGERTYLVRGVPARLASGNWRAVLSELADGDNGDWEERLARLVACHAAVKAGDILSIDEMRELVRRLEQASLPHTCPHGRPTLLHLSLDRLAREFGRT